MGNYCCVNRLKQPTEPKSRKSSRSPSRTLSKKSTIGSQKSSNQSSARLKKSSSFPVKRRKPLEKSETKVMSPKSAKNTTQEDYSGSDESFIMESPIPIPEASSIDEFSESYKISESSVLAKFKSIQEESVDELDYSLDQAHKLTLKDRKNILVLLNIYQSDIPEGEEETLDGYAFVTLHESVSLHKERIMLLSSHALYFLDEHDLSKLQRRINIINISLMSVDKSFSQTILHLIKSELQGDI